MEGGAWVVWAGEIGDIINFYFKILFTHTFYVLHPPEYFLDYRVYGKR